jgi:hypothetical protein
MLFSFVQDVVIKRQYKNIVVLKIKKLVCAAQQPRAQSDERGKFRFAPAAALIFFS